MVDWWVSTAPVEYPQAVALMEERAEQIRAGAKRELVWLLEHPPLYTAGSSARPEELLEPHRLPVFPTGRGGRYTYHGPGQRIIYVMLDLNRRGRDVRAFVAALEAWLIETLGHLGVSAATRPGRIGIWVRDPQGNGADEAKVAALGIRLRHWVSLHGVALNVEPDLAHFAGIVPCGITDAAVTSLAKLGVDARMEELDRALRTVFENRFGPTADVAPPTFSSAPPSGAPKH
jgi:lipoyl(octanoyl) transferase